MKYIRRFRDDPVHNVIPGLLIILHVIFAAYVIFTDRDALVTESESCYGYGKIFGQ